MAKQRPDPARRLANLALRARRGDSRSDEQLEQRILHALSKGHDHTLERAIKHLTEHLGDNMADNESASYLEDTITYLCETTLVFTNNPIPDDSAAEFALFLVPLLVHNPALHPLPTSIPIGDDLTRSFRRHYLIPQRTTLMLFGNLYRTADLFLPPSSRYVLLQQALGMLTQGTPLAHPATDPEAPAQLTLRFLLGALVSDLDSPPIFTPEDASADALEDAPEDKRMDAYDSKLERWGETVTPLLEVSLPNTSLLVLPPGPYQETLEAAVSSFKQEALTLTVINATMHSAALTAVISLHSDGERAEVRTGLYDPEDTFRGGYVWEIHPFETLEQVTDLVMDALTPPAEQPHLQPHLQLHLVDGVQPLDTCADCGEPLFFTPEGEWHEAHTPPSKRVLN